ncbi:MAG: hypothetical protein WA663_04670, partial [Candidatus Acidiferrales bacterium]
MFVRNFGQGHSRAAICNNQLPVDIERCPADSPAFQFRSAHSGSNPLDDQASFKLRNRPDDDYHG